MSDAPFMDHLKSSPPVEPLRAVVAAMERAGLTCALGGSGLMAALGLTDHVNDWDLTTDEPLDQVIGALESFEPELFGPDDLHADHKLVIRGGEIEVIVGCAMGPGFHVIDLPTLVSARRDGLPIASPLVWAVAYSLMGRSEKSERLFEHVARTGDPHAVAIAHLRRQRLSPELTARLDALRDGFTSRDT